MEYENLKLKDVILLEDKKRKPLSAMERNKRKGIYPYYGAQEIIDSIDDYIFDGKYILLAEDGENLKSRKKDLVKIVEGKFWLNNHAHIFKTKENVDLEYLYYYLLKMDLSEYITGSTQPKLNQDNMNKIQIKLPKLEIQKKISKILSDIDKKIDLNNEINNNLQELINKTFIEYFVNYNIDNVKLEFVESDIGLIPKGWSIGILSDIVEFSNGYGFDSKKMLDKNENETFSVFKMGNINIGGGINKSKTKSWMKKEDCEGLDKFIAKKGDILMCMTDMKNSGNPLLGHTALIDKDNEFVINQRVGILRCTKGISYEYVYTLSNLDFFISDLRSRANSGVQVNLTTTGICNTQILIPDKDCIDKFNKIAKPLYEKKFNIMQQNETLEQLRDTLLPKLMNGEIDLDNIEI